MSQRERQQSESAMVTHEPRVPIHWPHGHVSVGVAPQEADECIIVEIHGVRHYLHATTAAALMVMLRERLEEFKAQVQDVLG